MTIRDIFDTVYYKTTVVLRIFTEVNGIDDDQNKYEDIVATRDNIGKYSDLSIMCIVAEDKDKILIELA